MKLTRRPLSARLSALHYEPDAPAAVRVVLTHGLTSCAASLDLLSAYLVGHGFEVLALDLPGHTLGCSGGDLRGFSDAVSCIREVAQTSSRPVVLGGHSFGGAASLVAATEMQQVRGVVSIAVGVPQGPRGTVAHAMRDARSHYVQGAALDVLIREMNAALRELHVSCPFLAVGAQRDAVVPASGVEAWPQRVAGAHVAWVDAMHLDAPAAARAIVGRWLDEQKFA